MAPRTGSRQRFLDAAADLFYTQSYHATGSNQLVAAGGAPKGSFYFHFPGGKEQLAAEALTQSGDRLREAVDTILGGGDLTTVFDALTAILVDSGFERGCPIAPDASADSEPIRQACVAGFEPWRATIESSCGTRASKPSGWPVFPPSRSP
ncbi:TetR/AcrR family transcriptional regulator [Nocardia sp. NBC_00403]